MENENPNKRETRTIYVGCCAPADESRVSFWGVFLLVIGIIWLLSSLALVATVGKFILPAIFITLGVAALLTAREAH